MNSYAHTCILWDVITRGGINSVCLPLVIHTLKLYRTSLYFSHSLLIKKKKKKLFHNLPNFRCSYIWRSRFFFLLRNHWSYQLDFCTTGMRRMSSIHFSLLIADNNIWVAMCRVIITVFGRDLFIYSIHCTY